VALYPQHTAGRAGPFPTPPLPAESTYLSGNRGGGKVAWDQPEPLFNPLQVVTINALADLPVLEYRECAFAKMVTNLRGDLASEL